MPSLEVRLILFAILLAIYIIHRYGIIGKMKERQAKQQAEAEAAARRKELREQRRQERARQERQQQQTAELLKLAAPGLTPRTIRAADSEVYYLEGGARSDRPAVLMLHGFAGEKENWAALAGNLVQVGWHVVAPDLAGFGQSSKDPNQAYDVTTQAKRVRALIQRLELARVHLVGCSMGGTIAAACAYGAPDEVASLTLIEPFGVRLPYQSELDELLAQGVNPLVIADPQAYESLRSFLYARPPEMPAALLAYYAEQAAQHRAFFLKVWMEVREGERAHLLDLLLPEIKVRTLAFLAAQSRVLHGATADVLRTMNPDVVTTVVLEGCGHFLMVEQPNETAQHLVEFFDLVARVPTLG